MPLSLDTRKVGDVTIIRCNGRIVAGATESLHTHIGGLMREHRDFVLHLGDVVFIDSSGLGTLVRLLTSTRRAHGDLKLCNLPCDTQKLLQLTKVITLFDVHESEEGAVSAFYRRSAIPQRGVAAGPRLLCVDQSADVLAYLRELLHGSGYDVLTNNNLHDSLILIRATQPRLIILGPNMTASPGTLQAFHAACSKAPLVELGSEFSTLDAGHAASELLSKIQARLNPQAGLAS
jgi:anti-sigma B factor antagonist